MKAIQNPFTLGKKRVENIPGTMQSYLSISKKPMARFGLDAIPTKEQPVTDDVVAARVISVPVNWGANDWHHIAIAWSNFNSGKADAEWALYIEWQRSRTQRSAFSRI